MPDPIPLTEAITWAEGHAEFCEREAAGRQQGRAGGYPEMTAHLRNLIATCRAALAREAEGWQPIETAPKDGTPVLLCWPALVLDGNDCLTDMVAGEPFVGVSENTQGGWEDPDAMNACGSWCGDNWEYGPPTHWRPLPPPPASTNGEG